MTEKDQAIEEMTCIVLGCVDTIYGAKELAVIIVEMQGQIAELRRRTVNVSDQ